MSPVSNPNPGDIILSDCRWCQVEEHVLHTYLPTDLPRHLGV